VVLPPSCTRIWPPLAAEAVYSEGKDCSMSISVETYSAKIDRMTIDDRELMKHRLHRLGDLVDIQIEAAIHFYGGPTKASRRIGIDFETAEAVCNYMLNNRPWPEHPADASDALWSMIDEWKAAA
jgi:hypothetical protein